MLGHKTSFNKFKNIEITLSIFTNHNEIKLEIITERKTVKHKYVEIKQHTLEQLIH